MINFKDYYIINEMVDTTKSGMDKTYVTDSDRNKVDAIIKNKDLPEIAKDGKAYVVRWADGRGIFACLKKEYLKKWLEETGSWADIVSIKYTEPVIKGKKLKVRK